MILGKGGGRGAPPLAHRGEWRMMRCYRTALLRVKMSIPAGIDANYSFQVAVLHLSAKSTGSPRIRSKNKKQKQKPKRIHRGLSSSVVRLRQGFYLCSGDPIQTFRHSAGHVILVFDAFK